MRKNRVSNNNRESAMSYKTLLVITTILAFSNLTVPASADDPSLKEIMQALRDNLTEVTDGLLMNDFDRIERGAEGIAQHPQIAPTQVKRVAEELGPEMPRFKQYDVQVHNLSLSIVAAAKAKNSEAVWADYQQVLSGCLGCHTSFKDRVSEALR